MEKQQKEYESEIRMLNETIHRLENHLAEQSKNVAEVRDLPGKSPNITINIRKTLNLTIFNL